MMRQWQKRSRSVSHADDWLMTYADMITLLLCFFAIFISVSIPHNDKAQVARPAEQSTPVNTVLQGNLPFYGRERTDGSVDRVADRSPSVTVPVTVPLRQIAEIQTYEPQPVITAPPTLPELSSQSTNSVEKSSASLPEIVDHLKTQGPANIEQKGDRLTTIDINSAAFFGSGSATLSESGKSVLRDVAANIKSEKFKNYQVTVEGHTDDAPIKTLQFPSNWELSTARAAAVVHFFLEQGVPAQRLRAAGYADTFPKVPNRDAAGNPIPANQALNRRVVIKLEKIDKQAEEVLER